MRIHVGPDESVVSFDDYERHTYGFRRPLPLASLGVVSLTVGEAVSASRAAFDDLQREAPIESPMQQADLLLDQILDGMRLSRVLAGTGSSEL